MGSLIIAQQDVIKVLCRPIVQKDICYTLQLVMTVWSAETFCRIPERENIEVKSVLIKSILTNMALLEILKMRGF